jgi:PncC family amidohydrolase
MPHPTLKYIFELSADVIKLATTANKRIATAESCTGGLIGAAITSIPGSSTPFKGGIIAYDNEVKVNHLGVFEHDLKTYGAVSEAVAQQMASGALGSLDVDIAVSVTGIAGPGGGTEEKPVGTVWIGLAVKGEAPIAIKHNFGDIGRNKVRDATCFEVLKALKNILNSAGTK